MENGKERESFHSCVCVCAIVAYCFAPMTVVVVAQGKMIISIFVDSIHHVVFFNRTISMAVSHTIRS